MSSRAWLIRPDGIVPYEAANAAMHDLASRRLLGEVPDSVVVLEHLPVYTAGRRASADELMWSEEDIAARGAEVHRIDRGGAFTFHGPGQLVCYPIVDLGTRPDAGGYLRRLEEIVIRACADLGIVVERRDDVQTGVWHGNAKVSAIGIRLLRARVTLHGFAVNCENDLSWFGGIVACGLPDHGVTSLSDLAGRRVGTAELRPHVERHIEEVLDLDLVPAPDEIALRFEPYASAVSV